MKRNICRNLLVQQEVSFNALEPTYVPELATLVGSLTPVLRRLNTHPYTGRITQVELKQPN